jgi:Ion channel
MSEQEERAHRTRTPVLRRLLLAFVSPNSYGLVLLLVVVTYVLAAGVMASWAAIVVLAQVVTVWFALRTSKASRPVRLVADVALLGAAILAVVEQFAGWTNREGVLFAVSCLLYLIAPVSVLRHLVSRQVVDLETVLGAVAAYVLIGMFFAFLYRFVGAVQSGPFFGSAGEGTLPQGLFFSFTTLTTTGYGNLVPARNPGQGLAVTEMLIGQLFLITAIGKIVAAWRPGRWSTVGAPDESEG